MYYTNINTSAMLCILFISQSLVFANSKTRQKQQASLFYRLIKICYVLALLILLFPLSSFTQTKGDPISVSPLIGPKIDNHEYFKYRFTEIVSVTKKDLDYAEIHLAKEGNYLFSVYLNGGEESVQLLSESRYFQLQSRIELLGADILDRIDRAVEMLQNKESQLVKIVLEDQNSISGQLIDKSDNSLILQSQLGELNILIEDIEQIELEGMDFDPSYAFKYNNPNATRYLFAPSAIPLKKGEGYYQNVWVSINSVNYGISDHVSISAGIELISTFAAISSGYGGPLAYSNIKIGKQIRENMYVGGGVLAAGMLSLDEGGGMAMGYGLFTVGNTDNNATLGVGYGLVDGSFSNRPIIVLSGMTRASNHLAFVSENWFVSSINENNSTYQQNQYYYKDKNTYGAISMALRIMGEKITFDLGLIGFFNKYSNEYSSVENGFRNNNSYKGTDWVPIPIPYLDLVHKF